MISIESCKEHCKQDKQVPQDCCPPSGWRHQNAEPRGGAPPLRPPRAAAAGRRGPGSGDRTRLLPWALGRQEAGRGTGQAGGRGGSRSCGEDSGPGQVGLRAGVCGQHLTKDFLGAMSTQKMRAEGIDSKVTNQESLRRICV